jgi:DNA-binding NarL/FixJ family response regulator
VLTTFDLDEYVCDALRAGASGFLLKDVTAEQPFDAVRIIAAGDGLLAPGVTRRLISEFAQRPATATRAISRLQDGSAHQAQREHRSVLAGGRDHPRAANASTQGRRL